jgi:hypothetical protein
MIIAHDRVVSTRTGRQSAASTFLDLVDKTFLHQDKGLLIRVAKPQTDRNSTMWARPPPTSVKISMSRRNAVAPCFLCIDVRDQTMTARPTSSTAMPVARKLGITVTAASVPYVQNL